MYLPTLKFSDFSNFDETLTKEWLITNGLGGYASTTVLGVNTRKYHGLLVAALHPPGDRTVCLAKIDEELQLNKIYLLGANEFHGAVYPKGFLHLTEFSLSPFPKYTYHTENVHLEKTLFMPYGKNVLVATYKVKNMNSGSVKIRIFPMITCRHFHHVINKAVHTLHFNQKQVASSVIQVNFRQPQASIAVRMTDGVFYECPVWIERIRYREEEKRGETSLDDYYQPGYFQLDVSPRSETEFAVIASASRDEQQTVQTLNYVGQNMAEISSVRELEINRRNKFLVNFYHLHPHLATNDWLNWIILATDSFVVQNLTNQYSIIAGYHWFEVWGRDTFVALPGLMLITGRFEDAKNVFTEFNEYCQNGLIPNFIDDRSGQAVYNTVDASLWYVNAVLQYLKHTGDFEFVRAQLWANLKEIVAKHVQGTHFGIHVDNDGLLTHGERLTWMDAEVDGKAVTPRMGKAVEIQALWYNTLKTVQLLAQRFGENQLSENYNALAERCKTSFNEKFWNNKKHCLFDCITDAGADDSLRPNQIFAVSLDFTMLDLEKRNQIVNVVQRELVTPYGLRTLERSHPNYQGVYNGNRQSRDRAYHNGTVWPWLVGPFMTAFRKTKGYASPDSRFAISSFAWPLFTRQTTYAGLGNLSEIFDGDPPHTPRGCIAQAWSVAEPLRGYVEDALQIRPKYEKEVLGF
ncbi:MAG: glycogen debranching enzyme N-terminal domain-containing protein [Candidatus Bathyarchaeota archaeon]|nr:glycogen debranching enzyme N-terminal domain-containing protein [Candidatus Bathyarchaeota archaeon]